MLPLLLLLLMLPLSLPPSLMLLLLLVMLFSLSPSSSSSYNILFALFMGLLFARRVNDSFVASVFITSTKPERKAKKNRRRNDTAYVCHNYEMIDRILCCYFVESIHVPRKGIPTFTFLTHRHRDTDLHRHTLICVWILCCMYV